MKKLKMYALQKRIFDSKLYLSRAFSDSVNFNKNMKTYWREIKYYNVNLN